MNLSPTPHPDVNEILNLLFTDVKKILQNNFIGMYLFGSLANGDFDQHSDIDIIFVTKDAVTEEIFSKLSSMHTVISKIDSPWAIQLEVAYIPQIAFERFDSTILYPHLDRGNSEVLHKITPESDWAILCHILRERGITLMGPDPKTLIAPISTNDLIRAVAEGIPIWFTPIIANPSEINERGYQSFFVLSMCRMLYTLKYGEIVSKPAAAEWGKANLDKQWTPLIERALMGRQNPNMDADPEDVKGTIKMMQYTLAKIKPTPHPDVNEVLNLLLANVKEILGDQFVGMYLFGSLANGDFDEHSDIDVLVVTDTDINNDTFNALKAMHEGITKINSPWAIQLEVSYIPQMALRRYDPANNHHPHMDRGNGESLHIMQHDSDWIIQRSILRERGITITGPDTKSLIDPVSSEDLKWAVVDILNSWIKGFLDDSRRIESRGYQSYTVLTLCRILHTHKHGVIVSKPVAVDWAKRTLGNEWRPLIKRAWIGRQSPGMKADPADLEGTLNFIRYTLEKTS